MSRKSLPSAIHQQPPTRHATRTVIQLTEYQPLSLGIERFSIRQAEYLWRYHRHQVVVEPPSFKTNGQWQLTAQGWIGLLPLEQEVTLTLQPKAPLASLFGLLAYAYGLNDVLFGGRLSDTPTLAGFADRLAYLLANLIQRRQQIGLVQGYAEETASLPYIRGQLDIAALINSPWISTGHDGTVYPSEISCRFDELTTDVLENQILVWTLNLLERNAVTSEQTRILCRQVRLDFGRAVSLRPCGLSECDQIEYHRLNGEYRPLIGLCRFFIGNCEPGLSSPVDQTDYQTLPFLINSASLFERFVAAWLKQHLPSTLRLRIQERRAIGLHNKLHFAIDLSLYDAETGLARFVMDTKYKLPARTPDTADIAQVVAYAEAIGAQEAVLIYPATLSVPLDEKVGRIRVRSLSFDLGQELMSAGQEFLQALFSA